MSRTSKICLRDSGVQGNMGARGELGLGKEDWILRRDACRKHKIWVLAALQSSTRRKRHLQEQRTFGSTHEQELSKQKLLLHPHSFRM